MKRKAVKSSNVASVGYSRKVLEVAFLPPKKGQPQPVYQYKNVPRKEYDALLKAESVGKRLHSHIVGKYEVEKVEE